MWLPVRWRRLKVEAIWLHVQWWQRARPSPFHFISSYFCLFSLSSFQSMGTRAGGAFFAACSSAEDHTEPLAPPLPLPPLPWLPLLPKPETEISKYSTPVCWRSFEQTPDNHAQWILYMLKTLCWICCGGGSGVVVIWMLITEYGCIAEKWIIMFKWTFCTFQTKAALLHQQKHFSDHVQTNQEWVFGSIKNFDVSRFQKNDLIPPLNCEFPSATSFSIISLALCWASVEPKMTTSPS